MVFKIFFISAINQEVKFQIATNSSNQILVLIKAQNIIAESNIWALKILYKIANFIIEC